MRREEVPQDDHPFYEGIQRACYAVDKDGRYVLQTSSGWDVEHAATAQAMSDLDDHLEQTRQAVRAGRLSPLAYHMEACQMTPRLLGQTARLAVWRVRRHLRPKVFDRLRPASHSERKLARSACQRRRVRKTGSSEAIFSTAAFP